jgi:hypothetical protein
MLKTGNRKTETVDPTHTITQTPIVSDAVTFTHDQHETQQAHPAMFVPSLHSSQPDLNLGVMPAELRHEIFSLATTPLEFESGLLSLAKSSTGMRKAVLTFMREDERGKAYSTALKITWTSMWQAQSRLLMQDARLYKKDFLASMASVFTNVSLKLTGDSACGALTRFKSIEINLNKFDAVQIAEFGGQLGEQIASVRNKPVKINAGAFNGSLASLQAVLQAFFKHIHASCPVILDLSMNGMGDADLRPILDLLKHKPVIYQLNLDGNPLCKDTQPSLALIELLQIHTPISHLYLSKTGFNDATANGISEALGRHACLRHLDLRCNTMTQAGAQAIIAAAGKDNGSLHVVRLQKNTFQNSEALVSAANKAQQVRAQAKAKAGNEHNALLIQLEDITIYTPNFHPESLRQQQSLAQSLENQRL